MFKEIIDKYENFSDALITSVSYHLDLNDKRIEIIMNCMNKLNNYEFETVRLVLENVISFRFIENETQSSTFINNALLEQNDEIITIDFFPNMFGHSNLEENENSDLKVKCRKIKYFLA